MYRIYSVLAGDFHSGSKPLLQNANHAGNDENGFHLFAERTLERNGQKISNSLPLNFLAKGYGILGLII